MAVNDYTEKHITIPTNNFALKRELISGLYRRSWWVELLFKWTKPRLRFKAVLGTSENAVKMRVSIAVCTCVLIAIVKKRMHWLHWLHKIPQMPSLIMFVTTPIDQLFVQTPSYTDGSSRPQ